MEIVRERKREKEGGVTFDRVMRVKARDLGSESGI